MDSSLTTKGEGRLGNTVGKSIKNALEVVVALSTDKIHKSQWNTIVSFDSCKQSTST